MPFDVFLSHNSREKPVVEQIAHKLKRAGLSCWLDKWCLTPGARWQDELAVGLRDSAACAVFVGPNDAGTWEREEVDLALDHAVKHRGFRVFLVLLPGVSEPFDPNGLSPFLSTRTWVDLRQGFEGSSFQRLVNAIKGVPLAPVLPVVEESGTACPYRGLQPFDTEHAPFYFGRDSEIQRLVEQLKTTHFLSVLGPSGSGKSSLVRAGLLPALRAGVVPGSEQWPIQIFTPGADPLTQLAAQLVRLSSQGAMHDTIDRLTADPRTLHLACALAMADRPADARVVWVVDQFEEIFTLCRNDAARAQFIANLLFASSPSGRAVVIITMRADFYHRCAAHSDLAARVAASQFLVGPLSRDGLRQAIEEPARLVGLEFEDGLVATILDDVEGEPGALPLLEHSLLELWERRRARMLTLEGYRESGGVFGAIARRADAIYNGFDETQKVVTRRLLLRLTHIGEGTEDTRRRAPMSELVTSREQTTLIEEVVQAWTDARLLTLSADETGERWVTVSHEALIRAWPRLRSWIDEDRAGQRLHRQITDASHEWQRLSRDESALLRGVRLAQAREFEAQHAGLLNELEHAYVGASDALQRAEAAQRDRRRRRVVVSLSAGISIALILAALAGWQWQRAERQQRSATVRGMTARSDLLRTQALATPRGWPALLHRSALLAIEARRLGADRDNARALNAAADMLGRSPRRIDVPLESVGGISPSADRVAVHSPDSAALNVLNLTDGATLATIPVKAVQGGAMFSPSGRYLIVASESLVSAWEPCAGTAPKQLWSLPVTIEEITTSLRVPAVFDRTEKTVAIIDGKAVLLLDVATGQRLRRFENPAPVSQVTFSADSRKLAWSAGTTASIFTMSTGLTIRVEHPDEITWLAIDDRGTRVATSRAEHVEVWEATGEPVAKFDSPLGSQDDGGEDILVTRFDETGSKLTVIGDGNAPGRQFSLSPVTELFELDASGSRLQSYDAHHLGSEPDGAIEVWDLARAEPIVRLLHKADSRPQVFVYAAEHRRLAVFDEKSVWIYDTSPGTSESRWRVEELNAMALSPDGAVLVGAGADEAMHAWDPVSRTALWSHRGINAKVTIKDSDGEKQVWPNVSAIVFSRDGKHVEARLSGGKARVFEAQSGREVSAETVAFIPARDLSWNPREMFSADGTLRAFGDGSDLRIQRVDGAGELARIPPDADRNTERHDIQAAVFSADGRYLVTGGGDKTERVWSLTGDELSLIRHNGAVDKVAFSADGRFVTTVVGREVATWIWREDDLKDLICKRLQHNLSREEWRAHLGESSYEPTCDGLPTPPDGQR